MFVFCWYDAQHGKQLHIVTKADDPDNEILTALSLDRDSIWMVPGTVIC